MRIPLMQRLISSLAIVSLSLFPSSVLAQQHFGGDFYQQQQLRDYLVLLFRDGRRVVTYPRSNTDLHENVAAQYGIAYCEQNWRQIIPPSGFGYAAVITQGFCSNGQQLNHYEQNFNPGYSHNSGYRYPQSWNGGGGGLCIKKQNRDGSFFQFGNC